MNNSNLSQKGKHHVRLHFSDESYLTRAICCNGGGGVGGRLKQAYWENWELDNYTITDFSNGQVLVWLQKIEEDKILSVSEYSDGVHSIFQRHGAKLEKTLKLTCFLVCSSIQQLCLNHSNTHTVLMLERRETRPVDLPGVSMRNGEYRGTSCPPWLR